MIGAVTSVEVDHAGMETLEDAPVDATTLVAVSALDLAEEDGGELNIDGTVVTYVSADHETGVVVLADALTDPIPAGSWLAVHPVAPEITAQVLVEVDDGEGSTMLEAVVPAALATLLPEGIRDPGTEETVRLAMQGQTLVVAAVLDRDSSQSWGGTEVSEAGVTAAGTTIVADSLASMGDVSIAGVPLLGSILEAGGETPGWLERFSAGVVARQRFATITDPRPAGEEWGYGGIGATCRAGRLYRLSATIRAGTSAAGAITRARLRYATDAEADLSSTEIAMLDLAPTPSSTTYVSGYMEGFVGFSVDTALDVLLTHQGLSATQSRVASAALLIEDVGPQGTYGAGSLRFVAPAGTPTPPPAPPVTEREYTSTWRASDSSTYRQSGSRRTDVPDLIQGYASGGGINGHNQAAFIFGGNAVAGEVGKTVSQALSGGTLRRAEVWLYFDHWWNSAGGVARLGKLGTANLPSSLSASPTRSESWKRKQGRWVQVPVSWFTDSNRGVTLGGGSSRQAVYYGRAFGHAASTTYRPRLRLTYTR